MQKITKLYRKDYVGQNVVVDMTYEGDTWRYQHEWVPNDVHNNHTTTQAIVLGNGPSRLKIDLNLIKNHKGGLLARDRLQSYGCNGLYRDFAPDFLVAVGDSICDEIAKSAYHMGNVVFANGPQILKHPGRFHIIPQDPAWNAGALATYLACFDGHKKVYLLGFDGQDTPGHNNNIYAGTAGYMDKKSTVTDAFWTQAMLSVFQCYDDVEFIRVAFSAKAPMPEEWKYCTNVRQVDFQTFILMADIGS